MMLILVYMLLLLLILVVVKALTIVWWSDGIDFFIPFLFLNHRNGFFSLPSPSQILEMELSIVPFPISLKSFHLSAHVLKAFSGAPSQPASGALSEERTNVFPLNPDRLVFFPGHGVCAHLAAHYIVCRLCTLSSAW